MYEETRLPSAPCSSAVRTLIGTIARSSSSLGRVAVAAQVAAERAGDGGEDDVVDGAAERVLDPLQLGERRWTIAKRR